MVHKRSAEKLLFRMVRRIIFDSSFRDRVTAETVSRVSRMDILSLLGGPVQVGLVPDVERGEVLVDSRGRGSFQR